MSEPAVWMCFANSYSEKLKLSDNALSSEVANLKPLKACRFSENGLDHNCFFCKYLELFKVLVPWKFFHYKLGVYSCYIYYLS